MIAPPCLRLSKPKRRGPVWNANTPAQGLRHQPVSQAAIVCRAFMYSFSGPFLHNSSADSQGAPVYVDGPTTTGPSAPDGTQASLRPRRTVRQFTRCNSVT